MDFRRFLAGGLLLWSFFSFSLILNQVQQVSAAADSNAPAAPAAPGAPASLPNTPSSPTPNTTLLPIQGNYPGVNISQYVGTATGSEGVVAALTNLLKSAKQILAPILVFLIAGFGIRLIVAGGNEEEFNAASKHFLYLLIGTAFVVMANFLSETFSLYQTGTGPTTSFLTGPDQIVTAAGKIKAQLSLVIAFLRYLLGGIAVFYVVRSGSTLIVNADEETANKQKEVFIYGFVGFLLIMISEALVRAVFDINRTAGPLGSFFVEAKVDVSGGLSLLSNVTNLFLAGLSGLFLFSLVAGGALYAFSAGNEERGQQATKVIIGSLIGLVIAFSSYTLVAEFSAGGRPTPPQAQTGATPLGPVTTPTTTPTTPTPAPAAAPATQ